VFGSREEKLNNATALLAYLARTQRPARRSGAKQVVRGKRARGAGVAWEEVRALVLAYPGMAEGTSYGMHAFLLDAKFFARFNEKEQGFVVHAEPALRDALLASKPAIYFTTPHYANYPALLVRLAHVDASELAALLEAAFRTRAKKKRVVELDARQASR
jgi:hypothetical protein